MFNWLMVYMLFGLLCGLCFDWLALAVGNETVKNNRTVFIALWVLVWPISAAIMLHAFIVTIRRRKKP